MKLYLNYAIHYLQQDLREQSNKDLEKALELLIKVYKERHDN